MYTYWRILYQTTNNLGVTGLIYQSTVNAFLSYWCELSKLQPKIILRLNFKFPINLRIFFFENGAGGHKREHKEW